ncbi:MAG: carboxypeptidase regulatory-like domain-containing protein [Vicinamibacterales bacterium]
MVRGTRHTVVLGLGLALAAAASMSCEDSPSSPSCAYSLNRTAVTLPAIGGADAVTITTAPSCSWTATSNAAWLTITPPSGGTGNGTVAFSAGANGATPRTGTISVGGQTVTVTQDAPRFTLSGKVTDAFLGTAPRGYLGIADVQIVLTGGPSPASTSTDFRGEYTITGLLPGTYTVSFSKSAYLTTVTTVQLSAETRLLVSMSLDVPSPLSTSNLTGYWTGAGTYPNAPFKLALVHGASTIRGTYIDGLDEGPVELLLDPPDPLPDYSPGRFTLAVNFGDAILYLECSVDGDRSITGSQRTSALGWNRSFPFTMTR